MDKKEMLLKEYELCQYTTEKHESTIWKIGSALAISSLGTLALFMSQQRNQTGKVTPSLVHY